MRDITMLHPDLQILIDKFLDECKKQNLPVKITETWRTKQEQDSLYAKGRTSQGKVVTYAKYPFSPHCWGVAFDFCRNIKGREFDNSDKFFNKVGRIAEKLFDGTEYDLFWGGDWVGFVDNPHIEMKKYMPNSSTSWLQSTHKNPEAFKKTWKKTLNEMEEEYMLIKQDINFDGVSATLEAIEKDGRTYIKTSDLEKLGIDVQYREETKQIELSSEVKAIDVIYNSKETLKISSRKIKGRNFFMAADLQKIGLEVGYKEGQPTIDKRIGG